MNSSNITNDAINAVPFFFMFLMRKIKKEAIVGEHVKQRTVFSFNGNFVVELKSLIMFIRFTLTELSAVGTKELSRALDKQVVRELKCVCVSVKKNTPNATECINPVRGR